MVTPSVVLVCACIMHNFNSIGLGDWGGSGARVKGGGCKSASLSDRVSRGGTGGDSGAGFGGRWIFSESSGAVFARRDDTPLIPRHINIRSRLGTTRMHRSHRSACVVALRLSPIVIIWYTYKYNTYKCTDTRPTDLPSPTLSPPPSGALFYTVPFHPSWDKGLVGPVADRFTR